MSTEKISGVVSTQWLEDKLGDETLRIVDATWYMPGSPKTGRDDYLEGHIPGAVFWDLDAIADTAAPLPVTLPSVEDFAAHMTRLGISNDTPVVVYDGSGIMSAARVWWMLRHFGHDNVAVLDGGMPKWKAEGRTLEAGENGPAAASPAFRAAPRRDLLATFEDMLAHVAGSGTQILDARGAARFRGQDVETRPNTRAGHMPGSFNLPFGNLLNPDKTMVAKDALPEKFAASGIDAARPIAVTCGSGVSAPVLALGLFLTGKDDVAVYDGSWNEWGAHPDALVVKD